jgi:predicted MFS family arabinose efflux permease
MAINFEEKSASLRSPWPYLGLIFLTYLLTNFNSYRLQPILPTVMKTLNIDVAQAGVLISAATFFSIFITLPIGLMIPKIGVRLAGLLSMAFLFCGAVLASALSSSYRTIIIAVILGGIGKVFIAVSGPVFINQLFRKGHHAAAMSIFTSASMAAQFMTFILLPRITAVGRIKPAWRIDLVLSFVSFVLWIICVRKSMVVHEKAPEEGPLYIRKGLTNPTIWKLASSIFLFYIATMGVLGYLPSYLVSERGMELTQASFICSFNAIVGFCCAIFAGFLSDRLRTTKWIFLAAVLITAALRVLQVTVPTGLLLIVITIIQGIPAAGSSMIFSAITHAVTDPKERSIGVAAVMTGFLGGNALSPLLFGSLVQALGYTTSFFIMAPIAMASLIGIFSTKNVK